MISYSLMESSTRLSISRQSGNPRSKWTREAAMATPPDLLDNQTAVVITRNPGGQLTPYERLLANIQGHILKDHGRDYSLYVLVQFLTPELGRSWIQDFARHVT